MARKNDISFRDSVNQMFDAAVNLMELPKGLEEKIRVLLTQFLDVCIFL